MLFYYMKFFFILIAVFLLIAVKCDSANMTSLVSNSLFNYKSITEKCMNTDELIHHYTQQAAKQSPPSLSRSLSLSL
jgi:hypothetical protein